MWNNGGELGLYVVTVTEVGKPVTKMYYGYLKREVLFIIPTSGMRHPKNFFKSNNGLM